MDDQRNSRRRNGFTLIELLVVLGIIAVLSAIAFTAFQAMQRTAAEKRTHAMLANASAMLAEYGANNALKDQPGYMWDTTPTKYLTANFDIWNDGNPATVPDRTVTPNTRLDPLNPPPDAMEDDLSNVLKSQAVLNTAVVMRELKRAPGVETMIAQLPANSSVMVYEPNTTIAIGPVLLDGWGHPIIFVPASGLAGIIIGEPTDPGNPFRVTSVKSYPAGSLTATQAIATIPGARPFFASAGPDGMFAFGDKDGNMAFSSGDLSAGDDNLYSFEK